MSGFNNTSSSLLVPSTTQSVIVVTITSSQADSGITEPPVVVTEFSTTQFTASATRSSSSSAQASQTSGASIPSQQGSSSGLGTGGTIAVAVAVPVVVIAILLALGCLFWRRKKRNKAKLAQRKDEHDVYAFHPANESFGTAAPVSLATGSGAYRGWQPTRIDQQGPSTNTNGFQAGRGIVPLTTQQSALTRKSSGGTELETPTLPAFGLNDDLDSEVASPVQSHYNPSATLPGNGSPPLDAINRGSPTSQYSEAIPGRNPPYPSTNRSPGMASFMPPLHPGPDERQPTIGHIKERAYADGKSYMNF